jgi:hypothetical protein
MVSFRTRRMAGCIKRTLLEMAHKVKVSGGKKKQRKEE